MVTIRLQRIGKRHQPSYRVVVAERRSKLGGPPIEDVGSYNPFNKEAHINHERVLYWLSKGAKPSPTTHNLFVAHKVISSPKVSLRIKALPQEAKKETEVEAETKNTSENNEAVSGA